MVSTHLKHTSQIGSFPPNFQDKRLPKEILEITYCTLRILTRPILMTPLAGAPKQVSLTPQHIPRILSVNNSGTFTPPWNLSGALTTSGMSVGLSRLRSNKASKTRFKCGSGWLPVKFQPCNLKNWWLFWIYTPPRMLVTTRIFCIFGRNAYLLDEEIPL